MAIGLQLSSSPIACPEALFPLRVQLPATFRKALPSIDVGDPIAQSAVLGIRHENVTLQPDHTLRFLEDPGAEIPVFGARILDVDIGAAVATEEAEHGLGRFIELERAVDLELGASG